MNLISTYDLFQNQPTKLSQKVIGGVYLAPFTADAETVSTDQYSRFSKILMYKGVLTAGDVSLDVALFGATKFFNLSFVGAKEEFVQSGSVHGYNFAAYPGDWGGELRFVVMAMPWYLYTYKTVPKKAKLKVYFNDKYALIYTENFKLTSQAYPDRVVYRAFGCTAHTTTSESFFIKKMGQLCNL